jgi:hypothetical protein
MKNFIISLVLIAIAAAVVQSFLPWWSLALATMFISFFIEQKAAAAFAAGFLGIALLWLACAGFINNANDGLLAHKMAELLKPLTQGSVAVLLVITAIIGGLVGGFAALTGNLMKQAFSGK